MPNKVLVIISCYNEEGRIVPVIEATRRSLPDADIIVVDDGSTDKSNAEARGAGAHVLRHPCNLGAGAASETGYLYALRHGYDQAVQLDGDGQHPPEDLPRLLRVLDEDEADLAIGSRYVRKEDHAETPLVRELGHRLFSGIVRVLVGIKVLDPTSGFRAMNRRVLRLFADGVYPYDYPDSDVILMAHLSGVRIREIPVRMLEREGGQSMHSGLRPLYYGIKMTFSMFIVLLNWRQWRRWRKAS